MPNFAQAFKGKSVILVDATQTSLLKSQFKTKNKTVTFADVLVPDTLKLASNSK